MSYREYSAPIGLEHLIHSFWSIDSLPSDEVHRVIPDGCSDIIFNLGTSDCSIQRETIGISGMMTTYRDVSMDSSSELLGIRFRAGQLKNLTSAPLSVTKNLNIIASEIIPQFNSELLEKVADHTSIGSRLTTIEKALRKTISVESGSLEPLIISVIEDIEVSSGQCSSDSLAYKYCLSLRQLERKFKESVGVTIKEFSRITRFKSVSETMEREPHLTISEIAFEQGYYDPSHLTNEFRKFSGKAPSKR